MTSGQRLSSYGSAPFMILKSIRIEGALQYATITRPKIAYCVNRVCQFMNNPLLSLWQAVKLLGRTFGFRADFTTKLSSTNDTRRLLWRDWASSPDDRRSTSGFCVFLGSYLISWHKKTACCLPIQYRSRVLESCPLGYLHDLDFLFTCWIEISVVKTSHYLVW